MQMNSYSQSRIKEIIQEALFCFSLHQTHSGLTSDLTLQVQTYRFWFQYFADLRGFNNIVTSLQNQSSKSILKYISVSRKIQTAYIKTCKIALKIIKMNMNEK